MMNTYNNMRQDGFSSDEIASRLNAGGVYNDLEQGSQSNAFQNSGGVQPTTPAPQPNITMPTPTGPTRQQQRQLNQAIRQAARQERQQERQNERDQQRDAQEK